MDGGLSVFSDGRRTFSFLFLWFLVVSRSSYHAESHDHGVCDVCASAVRSFVHPREGFLFVRGDDRMDGTVLCCV